MQACRCRRATAAGRRPPRWEPAASLRPSLCCLPPTCPTLPTTRRLANRAAEAAPILERSETLKRTFSSVPRENAAAAAVAAAGGPRSVGRLLGSRLADLGMDCFFGVPGEEGAVGVGLGW